MQILGSTALAGRKRMTVLVLGRKQRHVAIVASSYQFYERARQTRFYFPPFSCMRDPCTHTITRFPFMHASPVDLERFMPGARCNETSSLPLLPCQNNDKRDNIGRVSINSAIRPDFSLLNVYGRGFLIKLAYSYDKIRCCCEISSDKPTFKML